MSIFLSICNLDEADPEKEEDHVIEMYDVRKKEMTERRGTASATRTRTGTGIVEIATRTAATETGIATRTGNGRGRGRNVVARIKTESAAERGNAVVINIRREGSEAARRKKFVRRKKSVSRTEQNTDPNLEE